MVIIMNPDATAENIKDVIQAIHGVGLEAKIMEGAQQKIVGVIGDKRRMGSLAIDAMAGVAESVSISKSYKLASREFHPMSTVIDGGGIKSGAGTPVVMAGPCAVESREQLMEAAEIVKKGGAEFLRGGAYKPRTSPYAFQGLEEEGLKLLAEAREKTGLKVVTEVTEVENVALVSEYVDVLQIGARNMQNFRLLKEVGRGQKPVMLKRGLAATIDEWLNAAEYIMNEGNPNVIFCDHRRSEPRYRQVALRAPHGVRLDRCRRRRADHGDAPEPGEGAFGRPAVADPRELLRGHARRQEAGEVHAG